MDKHQTKKLIIKISAIVMFVYAGLYALYSAMSCYAFTNPMFLEGHVFSLAVGEEKVFLLFPHIVAFIISIVAILCGVKAIKKTNFTPIFVSSILLATAPNVATLMSKLITMYNSEIVMYIPFNINVFSIILMAVAIGMKIFVGVKFPQEKQLVEHSSSSATESVQVENATRETSTIQNANNTQSAQIIQPVQTVTVTENNSTSSPKEVTTAIDNHENVSFENSQKANKPTKVKKERSGRAKAFIRLALLSGFVLLLGIILLIIGLLMTDSGLTLIYISIGVMLLAVGLFVSQIFPILNSFCDRCGTNYNYDTDVSWYVSQVTVEGTNKYADVKITTVCPNCGYQTTFSKKFKVEYYNQSKNTWVQNNVEAMVRKYFWKNWNSNK